MWIFCCGMPRSGSTLQFQITAQLIENEKLGKRIEWNPAKQFSQIQIKYADYKKKKVFKTHKATDDIIKEFQNKNAIGVYIFRDLRDVILSHMRKYLVDFQYILNTKFIENRIKNHKKWIALGNILVSKYETVMKDLTVEVERIANHLGLYLNNEEYKKIADKFKIDEQLKRIKKYKMSLSPEDLKKDGVIYNPHNQLHIDHIHSGEVGGYKNFFSESDIRIIEDIAGDWLIENGYTLLK